MVGLNVIRWRKGSRFLMELRLICSVVNKHRQKKAECNQKRFFGSMAKKMMSDISLSTKTKCNKAVHASNKPSTQFTRRRQKILNFQINTQYPTMTILHFGFSNYKESFKSESNRYIKSLQ